MGQTQVLMDKWDALETLRLIERYQVTSSHMVATMFHRLLKLPEDQKRSYDCGFRRSILMNLVKSCRPARWVRFGAPCPLSAR